MPRNPEATRAALATINASLAAIPCSTKYTISPRGLEVHEPLTRDEWLDIGKRIGMAMRSAAFVTGDWLVYGEGRDAQLTLLPEMPAQDEQPKSLYEDARAATGMDIATLQQYAYVSRRVPFSLRSEAVSFEAHRKVAKLQSDHDKKKWIALVEERASTSDPISCRRLARSIAAGRVIEADEMREFDEDRGIETAGLHVGRLLAFVRGLERSGWMRGAGPEKIGALRRDLEPILELADRLDALAAHGEA